MANIGYRIGDLVETTTVADADNIEISRAGSTGSFKIQIVNLLKSVLPVGRLVATLAAYLFNNSKFNVLDYGAVGNGTVDDAPAFRSAVAAASATASPSAVYIPDGYNFRLSSLVNNATVTVAVDGVQIVGPSGKRNAVVTFDPGVSGAECFKWEKASGLQVLYQCGIKNLMIQAAATSALVKTAMHLRNCSEFELEDVFIYAFNDASCSSKGVYMEGRELCRWRNFTIRADRAFHVAPCPDGAGIDFDWQNFENIYFASELANTNTCFLIDPATIVTNLKIDGFALVGYKHGIYWDAAPPFPTSGVIAIDNLRAEQGTDGTGWSVYLGGTAGTRMFSLKNARFDPGRHGLRLRGLEQVTLDTLSYENNAGKTAIDIDGTCTNVRWRNFFAQAGSVASVASNLQYLTRGPKRLSGSPIPTDAVLQSTTVTEPPIFQVGELGGGGMNTVSDIKLSVPSAVATALTHNGSNVVLPSAQCTYIASGTLRGSASATAFALAFIVSTGGTYVVTSVGAGAAFTFSVAVDGTLKVTQSTGGPLDFDWQISRYAFSRT